MRQSRLRFLLPLLVLIAIGATTQTSYPPALQDINLVVRDYASNIQATDRDWYYLDSSGDELAAGGGQHPSVEWDNQPNRRPGPNVNGVAYPKATTSLQLTIKFRNDRQAAVTGSLTMEAVRLKIPTNDPNNPWEYTTLGFSPTSAQSVSLAANGGTQSFTYTFSSLPTTVSLGVIQVKYNLPIHEEEGTWCNNGTHGGYVDWEWLYKVAATPTGLQTVPWTDFLNYSCRWAYGASTESETRTELTRGMHYSNRSPAHFLVYDAGHTWTYVNYDTGKLKLRTFTLALDQNDYINMDCHEFAQILRCAMQSQGYSGDSVQYAAQQYISGAWQNVDFLTNRICPAGSDSTKNGQNGDPDYYDEEEFVVHVVFTSGDYRFDSSNS